MKPKNKNLIKLDAVRGLAALYVVIHHFLLGYPDVHKVIKLMFTFGQEAVMVFFILSGFVIYWSVSNTPNISFESYFKKRFRRIYFPFSISILISVAIFYWNGDLFQDFSWINLGGNILMLQDISSLKPGTWVRPFLDNLPLWSLTYEWWFYMLFFPIYKTLFKLPHRIYYILAFSMIAYLSYMVLPNEASLVFSYFIIWWSGVEIADIYKHKGSFTISTLKPILFCLTSMLALTLVPVLSVDKIQFGYYPFLTFRHFFVVELMIILGMIYSQMKIKAFDKILLSFAALAPISYGLYIFHYPILRQWDLSSYNLVVINVLKISLLVLLAYLVEVKLQPIVNRWIK